MSPFKPDQHRKHFLCCTVFCCELDMDLHPHDAVLA